MICKDRFAGKVAIVTGGTSGIGKCVAERFVAEGGKVAVVGTNKERMEAICNALGKGNAVGILRDISVKAEAAAAVEAAIQAYGHIDCLFNLAGITYRKYFLEMEEDGYDRVMNVNVKSVINMSQPVARHMIEKGIHGTIVNTSSLSAHLASPTIPAYCCSKGAVASLTKSMAITLITDGIRVNLLTPGFTETPFTAPTIADPEKAKLFTSDMPIGRIGRPEEQAAVALFLASDDSSFMVGSEIIVDGGVSVKN